MVFCILGKALASPFKNKIVGWKVKIRKRAPRFFRSDHFAYNLNFAHQESLLYG